ncbi:hypothetical protein RI065_00695 [Mycoplasmatota bacterium zrk1]
MTKSAAESDCAQLEKWKMEGMEELGYEPKGVLIVNAFAEKDISERQEYFPNQMLQFATKKEHCLLSSEVLLYIYEEYKNQEITTEEVYKSLFQKVGVYEREDLKSHS